jgi:pyruvate-formate lyase-activating enzyme
LSAFLVVDGQDLRRAREAPENYRDLTDLFLYDCKETRPDLHRQSTGVALEPILDNLRLIDEKGARIVLRCPFVGGVNDRPDHLRGIAAIAAGLRGLVQIDVLPYHPLGHAKSARIGRDGLRSARGFAADRAIDARIAELAAMVTAPVLRG